MSKRIAVSMVVAILITAQVVLACSCGYVPLCQRIANVEVLFVGKAIETNDDYSGKAGVWYRFSVEESIKGLPAGTREVLVDPGSGSYCDRAYGIGRRYFISSYAPSSRNQPSDSNAVLRSQNEENRPEGIVVFSGECSGSLLIEDAAEDIAFARQYFSNPQPARLFGSARINADEGAYHFESFPALKDVAISITGSGRHYRKLTDKEGRFDIEGVAPGDYKIRPELSGYKSKMEEYEITVPAHGCGSAKISMVTNSKISGRVLLGDGSPAKSVQVEYRNVEPRYRYNYLEDSQTDEQGRFHFSGVPSGTFYVGVNIKSAPDSGTPFPPTYWPGVIDVQNARVVTLKPNETKGNLQFKLGPKSEIRIVTVKVFWPDRKPAIDAGVLADIEYARADFQKTDANGEVRLELFSGVPYRIAASTFISEGAIKPASPALDTRFESEEVNLTAGSGPSEMLLVLSKQSVQR